MSICVILAEEDRTSATINLVNPQGVCACVHVNVLCVDMNDYFMLYYLLQILLDQTLAMNHFIIAVLLPELLITNHVHTIVSLLLKVTMYNMYIHLCNV